MIKKEEGFDTALSVTRMSMRIHGIWPGYAKSDSKIVRNLYLLPAFMIVAFINIPQTVLMFRVGGDFNKILNLLTLGDVAVATSVFKLFSVTYKSEVVAQLITLMAEDWNAITKESELKVMARMAKISRLISIVSIFLGECTVAAYTAFTFYGAYTIWHNRENDDVHKSLYFDGSFPYDTQVSPNYEITWALQTFTGFVSCGAFTTVDALFMTLMLHVCGQLMNLQAAFEELGETEDVESEAFARTLQILVDKHHRINEFAETIEEIFNLSFLLQLGSSTMLLCLQGYSFVLIVTEGKIVLVEIIFMVYYTTWSTSSTFVYCYITEFLYTQVENLGQSIFYCNWYKLPAKKAQQLVVPLMRVGRPLKITAGKFFVFSLELFCIVVKSASGYIFMLLAVRENLG